MEAATPWRGLRVLLGVGGGIAAYKAADLSRRLQDAGAEVRVVMTDAATQFVTPLTFQALTGHAPRLSLWDAQAEAAMGHIELARWAQQIVIAPATADLIARLAAGMADDLLTTVCLASAAPLAIVPAMNQQMWAHAATGENVARLRARGVSVLGPAEGDQACGETGPGRMLEPLQIVAALRESSSPGVLAGRRVLVSAGPTYEDVDPVRFLGNRSSGRMGFAIAHAAAQAGAEVTLVAGPVVLATPPGVRRIDVRSAQQMLAAVLGEIDGVDAFVSAAAVADYRPAQAQSGKIKKIDAPLSLELVPTPDILQHVAGRPRHALLVGFAAETSDVERYAREKLQRKQLDFIAANRVGEAGSGFESEHNALLLLGRDGLRVDLGHGSKLELARALVAHLAVALDGRASP